MADAGADSAANAWTDVEYRAALVHLHQLQEQLTDLRASLPGLVRPLTLQYSSPAMLMGDFKNSAVHAVHTLKDFRARWEGAETSKILRQAQLNADFENLHTNRLVLNSVGLSQDAAVDDATANGSAAPNDRDIKVEVKVEDVHEDLPSVVASFTENNKDVSVELEDGFSTIKLVVPTSVGKLEFHITKPGDPSAGWKVTSARSSKLTQGIGAALEQRSKQGSLRYTLATLAAYKTIMSEKCHVCNQMFDSEASLPVVRLVKEPPVSTESEFPPAYAYHLRCVE